MTRVYLLEQLVREGVGAHTDSAPLAWDVRHQ